MAKKEVFQAALNDILEKIRLDAIDCLEKPPESDIASYNIEDLSDKALEYHQKGEVGKYLFFLVLLEMKVLEQQLKGK